MQQLLAISRQFAEKPYRSVNEKMADELGIFYVDIYAHTFTAVICSTCG